MKIRNTRTAETAGLDRFESNTFGVEMSGKLFDIVLDKIYTNKPRAITRELWTNAYDSHIAAGTPERPFYCQLPTQLDPVFTVRDFGVSMTHEEVMTRYSTLFATTKDDSDEFVGAFGIGSKSPFSYTDGFTVTVWLDGEERVYFATRGDDGVPTITHLSTSPSEKETGVCVSFPVQSQDFHRFRHEAGIVAEGFDVKPEVPGLALTVAPTLFSGDNWKVTARTEHAIRQGCVIYPVHDFDEVESGLAYGYGLTVDVRIGTVDIAGSREALSLDPVTIANVNEAFASAAKELRSQVVEHVIGAPDAFEANVRFLQAREYFTELDGTTFHGQPLTGVIKFDRKQVDYIADDHDKVLTGTVAFNVNIADELLFIVDHVGNDLPRKRTRLRTFLKDNRKAHRIFVLRDPSNDFLGALVRRLHLKPKQVRGIASLPDVDIVRAPRSPKGTVSVPGVYDITSPALLPVSQAADDFVYFEVPRIDARGWPADELLINSYYNDRSSVRQILASLYGSTGDTRPFYALTPGAVKRLKPRANQEILHVVKAWAKENTQATVQAIKVAAAVEDLRTSSYRGRGGYISNGIIDTLLVKLTPNATAVSAPSALVDAIRKFDLESYEKAQAKGLKFSGRVKEKYPLLFSMTEDSILAYVTPKTRNRIPKEGS